MTIPPRLAFAHVLASGTLLFGTAACQCKLTPPPAARLFPPAPPPMLPTASVGIEPPTEAEVSALRDYPIVDIHTHTFNALSVPLVNIAMGRIHDYWFGWLFSEVAGIIADAIVGSALENQASGGPVARTLFSASPARAPFATLLRVTPETVERGRRAAQSGGSGQIAPLSGTVTASRDPARVQQVIEDESNWLRFGERVFGLEPSLAAGSPTALVEARRSKLAAFLETLTSSDRRIRQLLPEAFGNRVALFTHHLMDMGPTYAQAPDRESFWDFPTQQVKRAQALDLDPDQLGRFIHFVAFSPFRSEREPPAGGWKNSTAIREVDRALRQGAWGVKYYPPAGYRPSDNDIPRKPWFFRLPRAQWNSRYAGFTNEELDELNFAFFEYCAENDIPVFAHCQGGEFQAAQCYGDRMAHPAYYRAVLERLANRPRPLHLRLAFGHAGGADFWFGTGTPESRAWGEQVYELCTQFPHVYCEVGILWEILDPTLSAQFAARLAALVVRPPEPGRYPFASKIMYGSDWFMPDAAGAGIDFLEAYQSAFLSRSDLAKCYRDFFCRNALAFLGAAQDHAMRRTAISPELRAAIDRLIARSNQP